jgi:hypothetical protein
MKTLISATVLALVTSSAIAAESWWGGFGTNAEIDPGYSNSLGDRPIPANPSAHEVTVSLDEYAKGNPDLYAGYGADGEAHVQMDSASFVTSLDKFTAGNPDIDTGPGLNQGRDRSRSLAAR